MLKVIIMASGDDRTSKQETCPIEGERFQGGPLEDLEEGSSTPVSALGECDGKIIDGNVRMSLQQEHTKSSAALDSGLQQSCTKESDGLNNMSEDCPEDMPNVLDGKADNLNVPERQNIGPQSLEASENCEDSSECAIKQDSETPMEARVSEKENNVEPLVENQHLLQQGVNQHKDEMETGTVSICTESQVVHLQVEEKIQSSYVSNSMEQSSAPSSATLKKSSDSKIEQGTAPVKDDGSVENKLSESKCLNSATSEEGASGIIENNVLASECRGIVEIDETQLPDSSPLKVPAKEILLNEEVVEGTNPDVEAKEQCTKKDVETPVQFTDTQPAACEKNEATRVEGVSGVIENNVLANECRGTVDVDETQLPDSSPLKDPAKVILLNEEIVEGINPDVEVKKQSTKEDVETQHVQFTDTQSAACEGPVDDTCNIENHPGSVGVATELLDNATEGNSSKHMENAENSKDAATRQPESGILAAEVLENATEGSNSMNMENGEDIKDAAAILPESGMLRESTPVDIGSSVEEPRKESEDLTEIEKTTDNTTADLEIPSENLEKENRESKDLIDADCSRTNLSQVSPTVKDAADKIEQKDVELKASEHVDANIDGCGMVLPQTVHSVHTGEDANQESHKDPCSSYDIVVDKQISEGHETCGANELSDACMEDIADDDMVAGSADDDIVGSDTKEEILKNEDKPISKREKVWKVKYPFSVGDLVWAKVRSHPWWPAQIFDPEDASESARKVQRVGRVLVAFYGDYTFAWVKYTQMLPFRPSFKKKVKQTKIKSFTKAVNEALQEFCRRSELALTCIHCSDPLHSSNNVLDKSGGIQKGVIVQKHKDITESKHMFMPKKIVDYVKAVASSPFDSWNSSLEMSESRGHAYGLRNFMVSLREAEYNFLDQHTADESSQKKRRRGRGQGKDSKKAYDGMVKSKKKRGEDTEKLVKESGSKRSRRSKEGKQQETPTDGGETLLDFFRTKVMNRVKSKEKDDPTKPREKSIWEVSLEVFSRDAEVRSKKALDKQSPEDERHKKGRSTKKLSAIDGFNKDAELRTKRAMDKPSALPATGKRKRQSNSYLGKIAKRKTVTDVTPERKDSKIIHTVSKVGDSIRKVAGKLTGLLSAAKCSSDPSGKHSVSDVSKSKKDSPSTRKRKLEDVPKKVGRRKSKRRSKSYKASPSSEETSEPEKETVQYSRRLASAEEKSSSELPLGLFMKFPEGFELPSESQLEEAFSPFGPLQSPGTKVDAEACTAQVVFKHGSDAETAWNHARKNQLFGEVDVIYRLRYLSPASRTEALHDADSNKSRSRIENGTLNKDFGTTDEEANISETAMNDDKSESNGNIQNEMMTLLKQVSVIVGTTPETGTSETTS